MKDDDRHDAENEKEYNEDNNIIIIITMSIIVDIINYRRHFYFNFKKK